MGSYLWKRFFNIPERVLEFYKLIFLLFKPLVLPHQSNKIIKKHIYNEIIKRNLLKINRLKHKGFNLCIHWVILHSWSFFRTISAFQFHSRNGFLKLRICLGSIDWSIDIRPGWDAFMQTWLPFESQFIHESILKVQDSSIRS